MTRLRSLVLLALAALAALTVVACGSGSQAAAPSGDVGTLLRDTFSGDRQVESGRLDLTVRLQSASAGPVIVRLAGPFESEGDGRLPKFALDAEVRGAGHVLTAGATSTGDEGYVTFQGQAYALAGPVFQQLKAGFEEAQKQAGGGASFAALGIDPRRWLTDARIVGEAKVGDADTVQITGRVDVAALLDDIDTALAAARALGLQGADKLPARLGPADRRRIERAVKAADVQIYTGRDDRILRRLHVDLRLAHPSGKGTGTVALDLTLTGVNEDQDIAAPSDPRPFSALTDRLGGLGFAFGGLGGLGRSGASGAAPGGARLERYSRCIADAGASAAAARRCARLLTP
jgi:hypothetical protein